MLTMINPLTVFFTTFATQLPVRIAAGGATLSRYISRPAWIRAINVASGIAIAAFGLIGLLENVA